MQDEDIFDKLNEVFDSYYMSERHKTYIQLLLSEFRANARRGKYTKLLDDLQQGVDRAISDIKCKLEKNVEENLGEEI